MNLPLSHPIRVRLTTEQAAEHLSVKPSTLEVWRCTKRHAIPCVKAGHKVFYWCDDLDTWLESRRVQPVVLEQA
ncbi:MAG: helix-turn-helix domain-containing protein [Alphaproteobacteria bacterium]|nr:helix-turn-helix domain-containing protein [Alphaproteobacteria bacterium]